jgi:hypothetical protein
MIVIPEGFKFALHELVDPHTFKSRNEDIAWGLLKQDAIDALHGLRTYFNVSITINDWFWGGQYEWSGYRSSGCTIGASHSEHRNGNAWDCKFKGLDAETVRKEIVENKGNELLKKITRLEADVSWVHMDCALLGEGKNRIYLFHA